MHFLLPLRLGRRFQHKGERHTPRDLRTATSSTVGAPRNLSLQPSASRRKIR